MITRPRSLQLVPLLAVGLAFALASPAAAQDRQYQGTSGVSATLRVNFGTPLHWSGIGDTRVEELPMQERPAYDMFRFGGTYYAYNNNRWYSSPRDRGDFTAIDERAVPTEFSRIPRDHWHNYPSAWQDRHDQAPNGLSATLRVNLGSAPHWASIRGTSVEELPVGERPNYDIFRSSGTYYVHDNDRWFMSREQSGDYQAMDDRDVPEEFSNIPQDHWRSYPSGWNDRHGRGWDRAPATIQVSLGYSARWSYIRGSRVQMIRGTQRPAFDLFRLGSTNYAFTNNRWYSSQRSRGTYAIIEDRTVPSEIAWVPKYAWINYPQRWLDANGNVRADLVGKNRFARRNY